MATREPVAVACEACGAVVATRHAWDLVACDCGDVTVSGRPQRPRVAWRARPGGGWREVPAARPDDAEAHDDAPDGAPASAPDSAPDATRDDDATPRRPIGFRP